MAIDNKFKRCEPDDPKRCQAVCKSGQCPYFAMEGSKNCPMHSGSAQQNFNNQEAVRLYRLTQWRDRVNEHADHDKVKSLREEIGILRVVLEQVINGCKNNIDLLMNSNKISDLIIKIEKLVSSCHRLEQSTGMLLDRQAALHMASVIVTIIADHVEDPEAVDIISNEIMRTILQPTPQKI